ncbi:TRAP transporter substrate-binding protein [Frigidibacter sp. ROC022]|uniref:TRAP transporter substrate-binding protein n=1 Tax=Frigidibacter sp. ROC022 TaxID=2971796 RepID=UPI00215B4791|nr:TRAP transporter substrate-binding protein [Frigidibacter sp. ROC022]MCR8723868.1 TRAP transporter substrate-binding protein [Frigidibacter sp. ROC022]
MTHPTRRKLLAGSATALAALSAPGLMRHAYAQDVITLRLHQFMAPVATLPTHLLKPWGQEIEAASEGRLVIEHFDAMSLGGRPGDLIDQARDGVVDITVTLTGYTPGRFPGSEVFELPFIMTDSVATARAYNKMIEDDFQASEFAGIKILSGWVHGPGVIHSAEPITKLEDMSGKQMRAPTRVITDLISELGATAVGMPLPQIPEALSKGVINGTVIPWEITPSIKLAELVHNHTEFKSTEALYTATFVMAMNQPKYDSLPDDLKAIIDATTGDKMAAATGKIMADGDAPGRKIAVDAGNRIIELDQAEVDRWKAASQPVIERWVADAQGKGLDGAALIEKARKLIVEMSV